jgi:protocatechuate 3,4-dioxygenase beta subunit
LALAWLAGVLVLLARQGWLHVRLARRRRNWREVSDPAVRDVFGCCREELRVARPVRLLVGPDTAGPATWGAFRASILLPAGLLPLLSPEELRLVLLHELAHVRRWDALLERVAALAVLAHWFNPVAWLALAQLRREREAACDAAVLRHPGVYESGLYGHVLLKVAGRLSAAVLLPGTVGVFGRDRSLVRRIHMIARYRRPKAAGTALGGLLLLMLGAFGLTDATAEPPHQAGPDPAPPAAAGENTTTLTVAGVCRDEEGRPLACARVGLYREDYQDLKAERLRTELTGDDGHFRFRELPAPPANQERMAWGYALVVTKQGHGSLVQSLFGGLRRGALQFQLRPAASLQGRVTDANGKPVAGAQVWAHALITGPVEGVCSTRTGADGHYTITDMGAWGPDVTKPKEVGKGVYSVLAGCYFDVRHPEYGHERPMYRHMPETVDVVLRPAGVIDGRVVDQVSGKPAAGVLVCMQSTNASDGKGWQETRTDAEGKYRLPSLVAGTYNLWAQAPDRAGPALDTFAVEVGKTRAAPDLLLVEGGWIEGQVVDAEAGKPLAGGKGGRLDVGLYGPSRPKSGAACQASAVDDQGRFRLHVAPGVNFPYVMQSDVWERTQRRAYFQKGIEVKSGEVVRITFRVLPTKPPPDPDPTPVRLAVPVPAERQAAALVRKLGGWYEVDGDNHVIEVNMVYHETAAGRRFDNDRTDTDEALRAVGAFPRLRRLYLCKGQASDDGLRALAGLSDLEVLFFWDAGRVTDAGVEHLASLTNLREFNFSNGQLGDGSLAVFGRLSGLRGLNLQGNTFSDDGLKQLAGLKQLRSLWIGMNRARLTDAGVRHLAGLTTLEQLDLQRAEVTDAGVAALKDLKQLRTLYLSGPASGSRLTDASVEHLLGMTRLQDLGLTNTRLTEQGVQRLLTLPDLKELQLSSSAIPDGLRKELQQRRPGLRLYVSGPALEE